MAPKQFSLWNKGDPAGDMARGVSASSPQYNQVGSIVDQVFSGGIPDPTGGATHYYNPKAASPAWGPQLAQQNDVTIGNHRFVGGPGGPGRSPSGPQAPATAPAPEAPGPIDPSIIAHGGTSPPIPGTTLNAPPAAVASTQGVLPGFPDKATSDSFTQNAKALDKALHGDQGPGQEDSKAAAFNFLPARNVSPLIPPAGSGQVSPQTYGTTLAGMMTPLQWGSQSPGQMYGANTGGAPIGQQFGTQLGSLEQMRQMMAMMGSPYGDAGYG